MEDNHSVVVSGLITCLMWGIKSKQRCPMNEKFKLAETYFIPSPLKGDTQFMTKKKRKKKVIQGKDWAGILTVLAVCVCVGMCCIHPGLGRLLR